MTRSDVYERMYVEFEETRFSTMFFIFIPEVMKEKLQMHIYNKSEFYMRNFVLLLRKTTC